MPSAYAGLAFALIMLMFFVSGVLGLESYKPKLGTWRGSIIILTGIILVVFSIIRYRKLPLELYSIPFFRWPFCYIWPYYACIAVALIILFTLLYEHIKMTEE